MKKLILSLLLCVIALAQMQAQTKSQILDDIENTIRDFCAEINALTEDPQSVQSDIEHISRNFASDEYFMYNGEKQQSFAKWLARYADIISGQEGVVHEFSLKETTLKRVDSNSQTDQRWYIKSELRRTVSNGNSLVEEIAFIVQWNGHERYVTILEMDGKWLRSVTRQTYSTEDEGIGSYLWLVMAVLFFAGACLAWVISKKRPSVSDSTTRFAGGNNLHATTHDKQTDTRSKKVDSQSKTIRQDDSSRSKAVSKTNTVFTGPVTNSQSGTGATPTTTLSQDDIDELYNWGSKYLNGCDVEKNYKKAVEYFTKAAKLGHAEAQHALAACYEFGLGVEKNNRDAADWYNKAAKQGHANAQYKSGYYSEIRRSGDAKMDLRLAIYWYTKAAEQGHKIAAARLDIIKKEIKNSAIS